MSLESEISSVLRCTGVICVEFSESTDEVKVFYESQEFFSDWPHGADEGTHEQQEEYYQRMFGVGWSLEEVNIADTLHSPDSQSAVFTR